MTVGAHISDEKKVKIAKDLLAGMSIIATATKHGSARSTVRRILSELGVPVPQREDWRETVKDFVAVKHSQNLDAHGNLRSQSVTTKPAPGMVFEVPAGHSVKGVSALTDPEGRILAQWTKTREDRQSTQDLIEAIQEAFEQFKGTAPIPPAPAMCSDDLMTLYPLADLHLNLKAWRDYSGEDYDLDIAFKLAAESVSELIDRSPPAKVGTILGLGDLFHNNDKTNSTPSSKHQLDTAAPWPTALRKGISLLLLLVGYALRKHETVEIDFVPGNHDPDATAALAAALAVFHDQSSRVIVGTGQKDFWSRTHGLCLFGATHGHKIKPAQMAMVLATDCAEEWGRAKFRHFFCGHIHHETAKEVGPVRVESFQSPAAKDGYSYGHGYRSGRSYTAITFHKTRGEISRNRVNITGA
jgi:hypothetical protein